MTTEDDEARKRQVSLHQQFTDTEEAYHNAYPDTKHPYLDSILMILTGRDARGFLLWGLVGVVVAGLFWVVYGLAHRPA